MENLDSNFDSAKLTDDKHPVILLSFINDENRKLIKPILPELVFAEFHSNMDGFSSRAFDLCMVDGPSFDRNKEKLQDVKAQEAPEFLPLLLLSRDQKSIRNNPAILEIADDVIYMPPASHLLRCRIQILLKQRDYSLQLQEKNRELEEKNSKLLVTQQQLQEEKERHRLTTENSTEMISRHTPDGTYLYVSKACEYLTGYQTDELTGQNLFANMHPEDKKQVKNPEDLFRNSNVERISFRKETKDGTYKWVETNMRPVIDEEKGELIEIQASTRDISARKKYERRLKEENTFIDMAIESLPGIFFLVDEEMNFVRWNNNLNNVLGYSDEELTRMHPTEFFDSEKQKLANSKFKEVFEHGSADLQISVQKKNGELVPYYLTANLVTSGQSRYLAGTGIDISERLEAENRLRESERRWESLVQNDPDLIQILDPDGTIKFINQSGAKILGFDDTKSAIGKNYLEIIDISDEAFELTKSRVQQLIKGNEIETHTYKICNAKGRELYLKSKAVPIKLDNEQTGLQQVAEDVTERVEYERELKKSLKEKETLLQEIHHRVKNNMAVVSGMLQLQAFNTENREVQKLLNDSENRIKTMALIHEKLYQSESLSRIDFGSYIQELVENIKQLAPNADNIEVRLACDMFSLNINQAVPCALIVNEVISNSYEHAFGETEEGLINISLKNDQDTVTIRISDNGRGMSEERAHQEEKMGFTIVKTLLKQLDADYNIENKRGFTFSFSFEKQEIKGSASSFV